LSRGIEAVCKYALPLLLLFAIILVVRVFTLGTPGPAVPERNVVSGLGFLWNPDWSELGSAKVWLAAAGQIFFTLSVGIGVILTYASYLTKKDDVALSGLTAASANEVAEVILGGSIVIPAAFAFFGAKATMDFAKGGIFDLGFVTMPLVLQKLAFGNGFRFLWFMLLFLAGITSSISLAQPAIAFLEDGFDLSRRKAALIFAVVTFLFCQGAIFGLGKGVLDELDFWAVNVCLVVFGTVETILFGWVFGMEKAWTELHVGSDITIPRVYRLIIKYVTPAVLITILATWFWQEGRAGIMMKGVPQGNVPHVIGTRLLLLLFLLVLTHLLHKAWQRRQGPARGEQ
jgi:SNF family Na+-dependent transporter